MRVVKAFSSSLRLKVLKLLLVKGQLSYTEIMNGLRLNPGRDAGRFAYHLRLLLESDLIELDRSTKRYRLTDLGRMVIGLAEDIESRVSSHRRMIVRTSKASLEEFDRSKIVNSLVTEAHVPLEDAQRVAREAERRLQRFKTKYLTAPLIREIVNAVLLERGLEEYRHKLTRLGLPVYDVTNLIKSASEKGSSVDAIIRSAGEKVFAEYTLLNIFPRDAADAHLSGVFHLENLGCWILKLDEFIHDLRFFFRYGIKFVNAYSMESSYSPPKSYEAALQVIFNILNIASSEVSGGQAIPHFNVFLAPFIKGLSGDRVLEGIRNFIAVISNAYTASNSGILSIGIDLSIPKNLRRRIAYGSGGEMVGRYAEFTDESIFLASAIMDTLIKDCEKNPITNLTPIINIRKEDLEDKNDLLYKAHELAAETSLPLFANQCRKDWETSTCTSSGARFNSDWTGDWELDTLRTGVVGRVDLNLPRICYDSRYEKGKIEDLIDERVEMAVRALEIKYRAISQRGDEGLMPFLFHRRVRDKYFRPQNSMRLLSLVGLNEALTAILGREPRYRPREVDIVENVLKQILKSIEVNAEKYGARINLSSSPSPEAAERLSRLDIEKYGWSRVKVQGDKEHPIYTDSGLIPPSLDIPLKDRLKLESTLHKLTNGSHLTVIQLEDHPYETEDLLSTTVEAIEGFGLGLFTYNIELTYCSSCGGKTFGIPLKCPTCGSVDTLTGYSRLFDRYLPLKHWTPTRRYHRSRYKKYDLKT